MDSHGLLGDKNLQLIKVAQEVIFELSNEPRAALTAEIEHRDDNHLIKIDPGLSLPDTSKREVVLLRRQAAEANDQSPLDGIKNCVGDGLAGIIGQREIQIITPGRPSHRLTPHGGRRIQGRVQREVFFGATSGFARR